MRKKYYSLTNSHPELAGEWDFERNKFTPDNVTEVTGKKVWWRCKRNHVYKEKIVERVKGLSCPKCALQCSKTERSITSVLRLEPKIIVTTYKWNGVSCYADCDGVCEDRKIVVEYDGYYWHKDKKGKDINKTRALIDSGYSVIRIREKGLEPLDRKIKSNKYREITNVHLNNKDKEEKSIEFNRVLKQSKKYMKVLSRYAISEFDHCTNRVDDDSDVCSVSIGDFDGFSGVAWYSASVDDGSDFVDDFSVSDDYGFGNVKVFV